MVSNFTFHVAVSCFRTASRSLQDAYESCSHLLCDSIISVELSLSLDTPYLFPYKSLHALESCFTLPVSNWCVLWLWSHSYPSCCSWFIMNFSCSQCYTKYIFMISILILDKIELLFLLYICCVQLMRMNERGFIFYWLSRFDIELIMTSNVIRVINRITRSNNNQ